MITIAPPLSATTAQASENAVKATPNWPQAYSVVYFNLINQLTSARTRLGFMSGSLLHTDEEVAACAMRLIAATKAFGESLSECVPEEEVPTPEAIKAALQRVSKEQG